MPAPAATAEKPPDESWTILEEQTTLAPAADRFPDADIRYGTQHVVDQVSNRQTASSPPKPPMRAINAEIVEPTIGSQRYNIRTSNSNKVYNDVQLVLIVGPTAAGKSRLLADFQAEELKSNSQEHSTIDTLRPWVPSKCVVSQFTSTEHAKTWLSAVGLGSIPSWTKPYHILSTGERFRADLARHIEFAVANKSALILDDFTNSLDRRTAANCCVGLAKAVRKCGVRTVLATPHEDVISWLQPDVITRISIDHKVTVTKNVSAGTVPWVRMNVKIAKEPLQDSSRECLHSERPLQPALKEDTNDMLKPIVLVTRTDVDDATQMCDAFFDSPYCGESIMEVPKFRHSVKTQNFKIGCILGPSGTGKSAIRSSYFGDDAVCSVSWNDRPVFGHFDSVADAEEKLSVVALGYLDRESTFDKLSSGEQWQASVARLMGSSNIVIDEFTSCLERATAIKVAKGIQKYIYDHDVSNIVLVGCHTDVFSQDILDADWVFDTTSLSFLDVTCKQLRGPETSANLSKISFENQNEMNVGKIERYEIPMVLCRCPRSKWHLFRDHHYKTQTLSSNAECFMLEHAETAEAVGFVAVIRHNGKRSLEGEYPRRAHRTVVLPCWQGLGIGSRLSDAVAEFFRKKGCSYYGQTVHPSFGGYRDRSPLWKGTQWNHQTNHFKVESWKQRKESVRVRLRVPKYTYSHEYIGPKGDLDYFINRGTNFVQEQSVSWPPTEEMISNVIQNSSSKQELASPFALYCACRLNLLPGSSHDRKDLVMNWQKLSKDLKLIFVSQFQKMRGQSLSRPATKKSNVEESFEKKVELVYSDALLKRYGSQLSRGEIQSSVDVCTAGTITNRRDFSKKLIFLIIQTQSGPIQVVMNIKWFRDNFHAAKAFCLVGNVLAVTGHPGKTRTGSDLSEGLSIFATSLQLSEVKLTPSRIIGGFVEMTLGNLTKMDLAVSLKCSEDMIDSLTTLLQHQIVEASRHRDLSNGVGSVEAGDVLEEAYMPTEARLEKIKQVVENRQRDLIVVLENPSNPSNVAAIMRTCEAFAVSKLIIISSNWDPLSCDLRRQSAGTSKWIDCQMVKSLADCIEIFHSVTRPFRHYGTALHSEKSASLYDYKFCDSLVGARAGNAVSLWFGNEVTGLSKDALNFCTFHLNVPMAGIVESFNLSVTVGIVVAEVVRQRRDYCNSQGLSHKEAFNLSLSEQSKEIQRMLDVSKTR